MAADDLARRQARFNELGRLLYVEGEASPFKREAMLSERKALRAWLKENDPTFNPMGAIANESGPANRRP